MTWRDFCVLVVLIGWLVVGIVGAQEIGGGGNNAMAGTPTLGACGTSPSLMAGSSDGFGTITVGTGVTTACTLNFSKTYSTVPRSCTFSTSSVAAIGGITALSTSAITFGLSLSLASGTIWYACQL